ncbi:MAG: DUF2834 domain-containing protein [Myxococcales bacterium]|jgi:hypothetical protein|nr:MAG: DUF2834 domain-containing protein [Myxococcales bacterium]
MNLKKLALFVILAAFTAYTVWVIVNSGSLTEVIAVFSGNPWPLQVTIDLALALSLVSVWVWNDARSRGVNPLPWLIATCFVGSIAPLAYLLLRPEAPIDVRDHARHAHAASVA